MFASTARVFAPTRAVTTLASRRDVTTRAAFDVGTRVRVKSSVIVYHVPKTKGQAVDLAGLEGVVDARADVHDGKKTSATMPCKVALPVPDGSGKTFIAHLEEEELELA